MAEQTKKWYQSKTILASLLTIVSLLLSQAGFELSADDQGLIMDLLFQALAVVGSAGAIYGRVKASRKVQ